LSTQTTQTTPSTSTTPSTPTTHLNIKTEQTIDTTNSIIVTILSMYASEKPVITITNPYTQKIEPKQRYDKWVAEIQQQKPSDYTITIQTGEQEKTVAIEGLLSQQEYQAMAGIQDTIDQMYHQLVRDQRLGQGIQQKKNTMKKAAQYASKQTPQNTQAIQATLALGHATTNKQLPENPDDIYNLVKKKPEPTTLERRRDTRIPRRLWQHVQDIHAQPGRARMATLPRTRENRTKTRTQHSPKIRPANRARHELVEPDTTKSQGHKRQARQRREATNRRKRSQNRIHHLKRSRGHHPPGLSQPRANKHRLVRHAHRTRKNILPRGRQHPKTKIL